MKSIRRSRVRLPLDCSENPVSGPQSKQFALETAVAAAAGTAFVSDDHGDSCDMDVATGGATFLGSRDANCMNIALSANGELFGFALNPNNWNQSLLCRIDPVNATLTKVAAVTGNDRYPIIGSAAFRKDGKLIAGGFAFDKKGVGGLYEVNIKTGVATLLTEFVGEPDGDLAFDEQGRLFVSTMTNGLLRFSPDLRSCMRLGDTSTHGFYGMAYGADGFLYAMKEGLGAACVNELFRFNPETGEKQFVAALTTSPNRLQSTQGGLSIPNV